MSNVNTKDTAWRKLTDIFELVFIISIKTFLETVIKAAVSQIFTEL